MLQVKHQQSRQDHQRYDTQSTQVLITRSSSYPSFLLLAEPKRGRTSPSTNKRSNFQQHQDILHLELSSTKGYPRTTEQNNMHLVWGVRFVLLSNPRRHLLHVLRGYAMNILEVSDLLGDRPARMALREKKNTKSTNQPKTKK